MEFVIPYITENLLRDWHLHNMQLCRHAVHNLYVCECLLYSWSLRDKTPNDPSRGSIYR